MVEIKVQDEVSKVTIGQDFIHVRGPDGVDVFLTPKAALATAKRIEDAAIEAIVASATSANYKSSLDNE